MKLKSKLIATIVSMCAAIAVMGVGVWASTANMFTVVVNNDVDVKILNVNADVYGEFAVYSQFSGSANVADTTPSYATRITATETSLTGEGASTYKNRSTYDHGYLLYAIGIGGYNDGKTGAFVEGSKDYVGNNLDDYGYNKYINEAKNNVFLATKNGTLKSSNSTTTGSMIRGTGDAPFTDSYNVDSTTHVAQVTYLYTINQWPSDGASNEIFGEMEVKLSQDIIDAIDGTKGTTTKYNSLVLPNLYVGEYASGTQDTSWKSLDLVGASGLAKFKIPETTDGGIYYVLLTFTFARNNANLDLSGLQDALNHQLTLMTEDNVPSDERANYTVVTGGNENVYSATNGNLDASNVYTVEGAKFKPNTQDIKDQVTGAQNQTRLQNCFALSVQDDKTTHLPNGFIYIAAASDDDDLNTTYFKWIKDLYSGSRTDATAYGQAGTLLG